MNAPLNGRRRTTHSGIALVIILAFVVLLSGLVLAYLTRTGTDRQVAHDTLNETKADQLARSAIDIVVADLKQEITDGSESPAPTPGGTKLYSPTIAANMMPMRSGTPGPGATPIPNLIRISIRNNGPSGINPMPTPGVPSRASALSSAPSPTPAPAVAKKGEITVARWNKHYLIPKVNSGNDLTDPVSSFPPPDWVLVTHNGPKEFATWDSSL